MTWDAINHIATVLEAIAAVVAIGIGLATTVAALRRVAPNWHITALVWFLILGPAIFSVAAGTAMAFRWSPQLVSALFMAALVCHSTWFAIEPKPIARPAIMWFVLGCTGFSIAMIIVLVTYALMPMVEAMTQQTHIIDQLIKTMVPAR